MPRVLGWSWGGGLFLMSEVPLYAVPPQNPEVKLLGAKDRTTRVLGMWGLRAIAKTESKTECATKNLST